jgi:hypothetical protein
MARCDVLCGPELGSALACSKLRVARLSGTGKLALPAWNALRALTVIEGRVIVEKGASSLAIDAGRTAAIGAAEGALEVELQAASVLVSAAVG